MSGFTASLGTPWPTAPSLPPAASELVGMPHRYGEGNDGLFSRPCRRPSRSMGGSTLTADVYGNTVVTSVSRKRVCEYTGPRRQTPHRRDRANDLRVPHATIQYRSVTLEGVRPTGPKAAPRPAPSTCSPAADARPSTPPGASGPATRWCVREFPSPAAGRELERRSPEDLLLPRAQPDRNRSVELFNPFRGQGGIWVTLGHGRGEVRAGQSRRLVRARRRAMDVDAARGPADRDRRGGPAARGGREEDPRPGPDARGDAFKEVIDGLIADFERRVAALRPATPVDASELMAWSEAVRDSPVFREDPAEGARTQAHPDFVRLPGGGPRNNWEKPPTTWESLPGEHRRRSGGRLGAHRGQAIGVAAPTASSPSSTARPSVRISTSGWAAQHRWVPVVDWDHRLGLAAGTFTVLLHTRGALTRDFHLRLEDDALRRGRRFDRLPGGRSSSRPGRSMRSPSPGPSTGLDPRRRVASSF